MPPPWRRLLCAVALLLSAGPAGGRRIHTASAPRRPIPRPARGRAAAAAAALLGGAGGPPGAAAATAATAKRGDGGEDSEARRARWSTGLFGSPDISQFWGGDTKPAARIAEVIRGEVDAEESLDFGSVLPVMRKETARALLTDMDVNGDGRLDEQEFVDGLHTPAAPERILRVAFAVLDADGDGRVGVDELLEVRRAMRAAAIEDSARHLAFAIVSLDGDGDRGMSRRELERAAAARPGEADGGGLMLRLLDEFDVADANGDERLDEEELRWTILSLIDRGIF